MIAVQKDTRRFTRIQFHTTTRFHDGSGVLSEAIVANVSYGGLCLIAGRYLKPQTLVRIPVAAGDRHISFPARVAWCTPDANSETFRVGLQADHRGKYTMAILSSWVLDAFREEEAEVC
jgi:hypothetical protein